MEKRIGFGIIGAGMIAATHAAAVKSNSNCHLVGVFDSVKGKAKAFCEKNGGIPYEDQEEFFANPEIQAVSIATPSGVHLESALAALRAGKHVIIEKPLEITPERCDQILALAREKNLKVSGVFQSRFYAAPRLIKKAIDEGRFGKLTLVDAQIKWFRSQEYYDSGAWRGTWAIDGGGALMNQGIHAIDLLTWFAGPAEEVQAFTATLNHERIEVEDTAVAAVRFKNGALGVIEGATSVYPGFLKKIEICGTDGSVVLEEEALKTWTFKKEKPEDAEIRKQFSGNEFAGGAADPGAINYEGHRLQFQDFAEAIIEDRPLFLSGDQASQAVRLICAIYKSAQSHGPVAL